RRTFPSWTTSRRRALRSNSLSLRESASGNCEIGQKVQLQISDLGCKDAEFVAFKIPSLQSSLSGTFAALKFLTLWVNTFGLYNSVNYIFGYVAPHPVP